MVTFEREFHRHPHGEGIEDSFCLARNQVTGAVFVRQRWAKDTARIDEGSSDLSIGDFLSGAGEWQKALLDLIGTLVPGN